jgi:phage gp36-like protein
MPYSTISDIEKGLPRQRIEQLTDDRDSSLSVNDIVNEYITSSDAVIDSFIAKIYEVPVTPTPELLTKFSVDITIYNLRSRKKGEIDKGIEARFEATMKHLKMIAEGKAGLGTGDSDIEDDGEQQILHTHSYDDRVLTVGQSSLNTVGSMDNF